MAENNPLNIENETTEISTEKAQTSKVKKPGKGKKIALIAIIAVLALGATGVGVAYAIDQDNKKNIEYYSQHFFEGSTIGKTDVSGLDATEAENAVLTDLEAINVEIKDGDASNSISGADLSIKIDNVDTIAKAIEDQDEEAWRAENGQNHEYDVTSSYDEEALRSFIDKLECVSGEDRIAPVDASIKNENGKIEIVPGKDGTAASAERLIEESNKLLSSDGGIIDATEYYATPRWTGTEPEFEAAQAKADKWTSAKIDYTIDLIPHAAVVDADDIAGFIDVDNENIDVILNDDKIKDWFGEHTRSFDTVGTERQYTTPSGATITLSGGHYGWMTDEAAELPLLRASIENGEQVTRDFSYEQTAAGPKGGAEWGDTYMDIDITEQVVRYIRNGEVIFSADTVTGMENPSHETQRGFYSVLWKASPHVMVGDIVPSTGQPEYRTPCQYFILFNSNGSAAHDATWRYNWSKSAHYYDGSHGCANMHYGDVEELYSICSEGDPVIVHD